MKHSLRMVLACLFLTLVGHVAHSEEFHLIDEHSGVVYGPFAYSNRASIGVNARSEIHYFTLLTESARAKIDLPSLVEEIKYHRKRRDDILSVAIAYYVLRTKTEHNTRPTMDQVKRTVPEEKRSAIDFTKYKIVSGPEFDPKEPREVRSNQRMLIESTPDAHGAYYVVYGDWHVELIGKHRETEKTQQPPERDK